MCLMKGPHEPGIDDIVIRGIVSNGLSWGRLLISSRSAGVLQDKLISSIATDE